MMLWEALTPVPGPRKARGKHLEWPFIFGVIATAILSHQRAISAITQWSQHHAATLAATFHPARGRIPSETTLRRALHYLDIVQLEHQLAALTFLALCQTSLTTSTSSIISNRRRGAGGNSKGSRRR
jgi:hypothetical protein